MGRKDATRIAEQLIQQSTDPDNAKTKKELASSNPLLASLMGKAKSK